MVDEYIRLDTTIMGIDNLINEAATGKLSGLDDAYLLRHDRVVAWSLINLERTASGLLSDGDNTILCENCMSAFTDFMEGCEEDARP